MKKSRIPQMSKKRQARMPEELAVRIKLAERCGGQWVPNPYMPYLGRVIGGRCEICGKLADWRDLRPAHALRAGKGGKLTMDNCLMACLRSTCHDHNKYPLTGIPLSVDEALKLIKKLNERFKETEQDDH